MIRYKTHKSDLVIFYTGGNIITVNMEYRDKYEYK